MQTYEQWIIQEEIEDFNWQAGSYLAEQQFPELEFAHVLFDLDQLDNAENFTPCLEKSD